MTTNDQSAGATPAVEGATPSQTPPAQPVPATTPDPAPSAPATGDQDGLGEGGQRALAAERAQRKAADDRAKALEKELADLKAASQTDSEKAIAQAKKDGASEVLTKVQSQIRRSEARAALTAAGATPSMVDLMVRADEFSSLKVDEDGSVEGLAEAVEAFKKSHPDAFVKPGTDGTADGGTRGKPTVTKDQVERWAKDPAEYEKHRDEIFAYMASQGQ